MVFRILTVILVFGFLCRLFFFRIILVPIENLSCILNKFEIYMYTTYANRVFKSPLIRAINKGAPAQAGTKYNKAG